MHPKKSLGQHWLFDETSLNAMLDAGEVSSADTVLEVGPGLGTLTKKLCDVAEKVIAVELDDILAADLTNKVSAPNLEVVHQSILDFDTTHLPKGYKVIANIPYYLTSNLIRRMLESPNPPSVMVLLIQKEVAERVAAKPGQMGILSVAAQYYAEASLKELVPAELFTPPPKVDSQILQLKRRAVPLFDNVDTEEFFKIVKAGFSEKRKKLRSSLSGALQRNKSEVDDWLIGADVSLNARAQELTLQQWYRLHQSKP
jgi:16S rRNA (adenine1518-N6/adenine1519-N6)-dimethyltransferase